MSVTFSILTASDTFVAGDDAHVNMSNMNARFVLGALDLVDAEGELFGELPSEAMLERVLLGLALAPADAGTETVDSHEPGRARMIVCGRPEGYLQTRLGELADLALHAPGGSRVVWG
jgi:hypothetical protein